MKCYKYSFFFILFLFGIILSSEIYIDRLENIYIHYPYVTVDFTKDNRADVIKEIEQLSDKYNVSVFTNDQIAVDSVNIESTFFYTGNGKEILEEEWKVTSRTIRGSVGSEFKYKFNITPLSEGAERLLFQYDLSLVGNDADVSSFAKELRAFMLDNYGEGSDIGFHRSVFYPISEAYLYDIIVWSVILLVLIIMMFFDVSVCRKEAVVGLTQGNSIGSYIVRKLLTDLLVYVVELCILAAIIVTLKFSYAGLGYAVIAFAALMTLSLLAYLTFYFSNIRAVLNGVKQGEKIIYFNHFIKLVIITMCLVLFTNALHTIDNSDGGYEIENTIDTYFDGYVYTDNLVQAFQESNPDIVKENDPKYITRKLYEEHYYDWKPLYLSHINQTSEYDLIRANQYAWDYLKDTIPELNDVSENEKVYLLVHCDEENYDMNNLDGVPGECDPVIVEYSGDVSVIGLGSDNSTSISVAHNPVIKIDRSAPGENGYSITDFSALLLDKEDVRQLCEEYNISQESLEVFGVAETYKSRWNVAKASLISTIGFVVFLTVFLVAICVVILKLEFSVNAFELSLKKVLGYTLISKYYNIFITDFVIYLISWGGVSFVYRNIDLRIYIPHLAVFAAILFLTDLIISVPYIIRLEKTNVHRILKGGAL